MAIALISGASRGIGRATALLLAQEGYTVAVNYHHNINAATEVVNTIVESGGKATALRADISDEAQVMAMFEAVDRMGEPLTALVNNAGILFTQCTVESLSAERINRVLATNYAASKGAVDTLTTGLALEVAAQGIRVNGVRPGLIYTEMHASGGEPGRVDRVKNSLPMQRGGQPEEVAQAIAWLLSDKASYVTGSFLELAGGK